MKNNVMLFYALAFVFFLAGVAALVPTTGGACQLDYALWHEGYTYQTNFLNGSDWNRSLVADKAQVVRPNIPNPIAPDFNLTLWFDGGNIHVRITVSYDYYDDVHATPNVMTTSFDYLFDPTYKISNNHTFMVTNTVRSDYYSLFLRAVTEPTPTYLLWFYLSGISAFGPLIVELCRFAAKRWREFWEPPTQSSQPN